MSIRRILVPVDFSEPSRAAFDYAVELARPFDARIDLLHCPVLTVRPVKKT